MKIEKITQGKIKLTISNDDLTEWGISVDAIKSNSPAMRDMLWTFIKKAEGEVDFSIGDSKLIVEAVPAGKNGLTLFITKLESNNNETKLKIPYEKNNIILVEFDSFEDVISLANVIPSARAILYNYQDKYYIIIDSAMHNICSEYGFVVQNPKPYIALLCEHGNLICAVDTFHTISSKFN